MGTVGRIARGFVGIRVLKATRGTKAHGGFDWQVKGVVFVALDCVGPAFAGEVADDVITNTFQSMIGWLLEK